MTAALIVRDGTNTARTITVMVVRDGGNVSRTIATGWIRDANNVLRCFYDPAGTTTLTATPNFTSRWGITIGTGTATTNSVTVTPSGGTGPYTYAWTLVSYDGPVPPTATAPTAASTTFTQTSMAVNTAYTSEWLCTVTDSLAATATCTVTANFTDASQ